MKRKAEKDKRVYRPSFRVNEVEWQNFLANCEAANLKAADYFRVQCCDAKPIRTRKYRRPDEQALAEIMGQVMRVGNNVNQISRSLNMFEQRYAHRPEVIGILASFQAEHAQAVATLADIRSMIRKTLLGHDSEM